MIQQKKNKIPHKIYIKNMVCQRCIEAVTELLEQNNFSIKKMGLGEVLFEDVPNEISKSDLDNILQERGFGLVLSKEEQLVNRVKSLVIDLIHYIEEHPEVKNSAYLSEKMGMNYQSFSKVFSKEAGITLEKYIILQKIEKVKELLAYDELNLNEIAYKLGYRSVQHLSTQFRNVTGKSVTEYKKSDLNDRKFLDEV